MLLDTTRTLITSSSGDAAASDRRARWRGAALTTCYFLSRKRSAGRQYFCLNVRLCIKPERREEFLACISANQAGTLGTEPLAVEYVWGEDDTTSNTFHFYEKYVGEEGFLAHKASPHFAVWEKFASSNPFSAEPRVEFYWAK